jgi:hypothetical protein
MTTAINAPTSGAQSDGGRSRARIQLAHRVASSARFHSRKRTRQSARGGPNRDIARSPGRMDKPEDDPAILEMIAEATIHLSHSWCIAWPTGCTML